MAVEVFEIRTGGSGAYDGKAVFVDNTTNVAFGPLMPSKDVGLEFLEYLEDVGMDISEMPSKGIRHEYDRFVVDEYGGVMDHD